MSAKLKLLQTKLGLVPKTYPPMSPNMERIARQLPAEKAPPPEGYGLGASIERLIADEVSRRVGDALEEQRQLDRQFNKPAPITDYRDLPPVPRTQPPKAMDVTFQRDELRRIAVVNMGDEQWRVQRGALGDIVRMVLIDQAPVPPAITPPYLPAARKYQPGEPR
ncbi:hypothetical protein [Pseudomonas sp. LB3P14]